MIRVGAHGLTPMVQAAPALAGRGGFLFWQRPLSTVPAVCWCSVIPPSIISSPHVEHDP